MNVTEQATSDCTKVTKCICGGTDSINIKNVGMIVDNIMSKLDQKTKL